MKFMKPFLRLMMDDLLIARLEKQQIAKSHMVCEL